LAAHFFEIYLEELDKALASTLASSKPTPVVFLVAPFLQVAAQTSTTATLKRIEDAILEPLINQLVAPENDDVQPRSKRPRLEDNGRTNAYENILSENYIGIDGRQSARRELLNRIFQVASQQNTRGSNRRKLYALWESAGGEDTQSS
jgi:ribosomal RNA-processing protein 1